MNLRRDYSRDDKQKDDPNDFNGKVICITGTIGGYTRHTAQAKLRQKFPKILFSDAVTRQVNILIAGHGVGQVKLNLAKKYNIPIIEATKVL
jgi:NAD-dependent DNA ligase